MTTTKRNPADAQQAARDRITRAIAADRAARIAKALAKPTRAPTPTPEPTAPSNEKKPKSGAIDWFLASDRVVGHGHASLPDTINRASRAILSGSGLDPDAAFGGFASTIDGVPVVADQAARDAQFPTPSVGQRVQRQDIGYEECYTSAGWMPQGITRAAGPVIGTAAKGAKRDDTTDDSGVLTAIGALIGSVGIGEIDVGTHLIGTSVSVPGVWRPLNGGILHVPNGINLRFTGPVPRGIAFKWLQVDVGGSVTFDDSDHVDPRWFGLQAVGVAGDEVFLNQMTAALSKCGSGQLPNKSSANVKLANEWLISDKISHRYDADINPKNTNYGEAPLFEWAGAAGGRMIHVNRGRYCKFGGFAMRPNNADVAIDIDSDIPGGGIGTQCTFERIWVWDLVPDKPNFIAFRINHSGGQNNEYHGFVDVSAMGGNNGRVSQGGHDMTTGMGAVVSGSNIITFDAAFLALGVWKSSVANYQLHVVGPAREMWDTTVTWLDATRGTLAANAPWTNPAAPLSMNRNVTNLGYQPDGADIQAGSTTVNFPPGWLLFGFWGAGITRRIRIGRADADVAVAAFNLTASTLTSATHTNAGWKPNQWQGYVMHVATGTGVGQLREIVSNTPDTLTWGTALGVALDGTSNVEVLAPKMLDAQITYATANSGTLSVAPKITLGGAYFVFAENVGRGIQVGTNYNTKGIRSTRGDFFYYYIGIEVTGGSFHSDLDNWNDDELCFAVGGAISEPITIHRGNAEGCRAFLSNNTFQPVYVTGSRWAMDRIEPQGGYFRFGSSAQQQVMVANCVDPVVGGLPRGATVFDFTGTNVHLTSLGNSLPYDDNQLGLNTLSQQNISRAYWLGLGDDAYTTPDGKSRNFAIRCFTRNRRPVDGTFALLNEIDGVVTLGVPDIDLSTDAPNLLRPGQQLRTSEHSSGIIHKWSRLNDEDQGGAPGGTIGHAIEGFDQGTERVFTTPGGAGFDAFDMGRTLVCDPTAGDIFINGNMPTFTAARVGWWCEVLLRAAAETDNIVSLTVGSGTLNGLASIELVGRYTRLRIRLVAVTGGIPKFEVDELHVGFRKNPAGPGALGAQWNPASIAAGGRLQQQFTIKQCNPGKFIEVSFSADLLGVQHSVYSDSNGHATIVFKNDTGAAVDLPLLDTRFKVHPVY